MKSKLNVLVIGVGGNVSQGILKALQISNLDCRVIGAGVDAASLGVYTTDCSYLCPYAHDSQFLSWLIEVCLAEKVDVILSGVEQVLVVLAEHATKIKADTGAIAIVSDPAKLRIAQDKYQTCQWLESHGCNFPAYALAEDQRGVEKLVQRFGFSLLAKPRFGKGSAGILEVRDIKTLNWAMQQKDYVIQEYLGDSKSEFTVGCFSGSKGQSYGAIVMRRELLNGTTALAEVGEFPEVRAEALRIVEQIQPMGPCNFQLRMANGVPTCFEINMRFSGTTPMRARFGFNEVKASLEHYVLGKEELSLPLITTGRALRYWNEVYIDAAAVGKFEENGKIEKPKEFELVVENYGIRS